MHNPDQQLPNNENSNLPSILDRGDAADFLRSLARGFFIPDLDEALHDVTQAVISTQKKGAVNVSISLEWDSKTDTITVKPEIKKSLPKKSSKASIFFPTPSGRLSRNDHRQAQMFPENDQ